MWYWSRSRSETEAETSTPSTESEHGEDEVRGVPCPGTPLPCTSRTPSQSVPAAPQPSNGPSRQGRALARPSVFDLGPV